MDDEPASDSQALDSSAPSGADPTLLSPSLRPDVLATPEQKHQRSEIAAALFGANLSIGRYRLLNRLGQGGMGIVYAAFDDRLDRKLAIKLLRSSRLDSAEARERTLREARALARLSHPNVVHVYEVGEFEDQLFVAMEFMAGPTLRAWLDDGEPRTWEQRLAILLEAGRGLAAAHAEGIIHRDFKPQNAMFGADGRVRVLDFGLATLGQSDAPDDPDDPNARLDSKITKTGAVLGTPAYMAPEQFEGRRADARSDQFGYCVVLYEALYGHRPFEGRNLLELRFAVESGNLRPVPARSPVPAWLRKVVLRGLSLDPQERFESMQALLDALMDDPASRRRKWWTAASLVGVLAGGAWAQTLIEDPTEDRTCMGMEQELAGVWDETRRAEVKTAIEATGLSFAPATAQRVEQRLDDYTQRWLAARVEACEATQRGEQSGELLDLRIACLDERLLEVRATVDVLAQANPTVVNDAVQAVIGLPGLERCADSDALRAEIPPPEDPDMAVRVAELDEQLIKARALLRAGQWTKGLEIADDVASEAVELGYEPLMAEAWLDQGNLQRLSGDYTRSEATLEQAYETAVGMQMTSDAASASALLVFLVGHNLARHEDGRIWAKHAKPWAKAAGTDAAQAFYLNNLGTLAVSEGKHDEARELHERALALLEAKGADEVEIARTLNSLGNTADAQGKFVEAREFYERALAIWERTLGPEHPVVAKCIANLGSTAHDMGDLEEATRQLERSIEIYEKSVGPEHPDLALALGALGQVAWNEGKYAESRRYQERALAIREKAYGPDSMSVANSLGPLGMLARKEGKYDEAREYLNRALAIMQKVLGPEHPRIGIALTSLGNLAIDEGKYDEARDYHERALAIWEKATPDHPNIAIALGNLGGVAYQTKDYEQSLEYQERALAVFEKAHGPDHINVASCLTGIGQALVAQGRPADAIPRLERSLAIESSTDVDPYDLAITHFTLAEALWDAPVDQGRDRSRALELAALARAAAVELGPAGAKLLEEADPWLAKRAKGAKEP